MWFAQLKVGFTIMQPTSVPGGLGLVSIRVVFLGQNFLYLLYDATKVNGTVGIGSFVFAGGIMVIESVDRSPPHPVGEVYQIEGINGTITTGNLSEVNWWKGGVHFDVLAPGNTTVAALLLMANSFR
jgi:hypothetical protein